jgi:hypothetical protein
VCSTVGDQVRRQPPYVLALYLIIVSFIALDNFPAPSTVHASGSAIDAEPAEERKDLATTRSAEAAAAGGGSACRVHDQQRGFSFGTKFPVGHAMTRTLGRADGAVHGGDDETHVRPAFSHLLYLSLVASESASLGSQGKLRSLLCRGLNARPILHVTQECLVYVSCEVAGSFWLYSASNRYYAPPYGLYFP